ncbi:MAG: disulfide bond formation protein B [bacterium]|nr:disulfide bond formation protein B [bacterium]
MKTDFSLYIASAVATISMMGSLYFSEIMKVPACPLCWYQRIFMYPLVGILAVGILRKEKRVDFYVLPFSIAGFLVALYHSLLYYKIIPEETTVCTNGISCATKLVEWFGFISIPLLSLASFAAIIVCMVIYRWGYFLKRFAKRYL